MASRSLNVQITGDAKGLAVATRQADGHLDGLGKKTAMVTKGMALGFAAAGAAAAGVLVVGLKKSVDAAVDAQKSQARLEAQLKASGISYRAHAKEIDAVIQKHSQLAGVDDEDLQDAFTNVVRATGNVSKSLKDVALITDLARGRHMDLAKAGDLVAKVHNGNVGALKRLGIALDPVTKAQDKLRESGVKASVDQVRAAKATDKQATAQAGLAELQKRFAGQADAYGKTAAGAQERFGVAVENLEEKVGGKLLPVLTDVTNKVATFVNQMESGTGAGGRFADKISVGFGKVKTVAEALWPSLKAGGLVALSLLTTGFGRMKTIVDAVAPTVLRLKAAVSAWVSDNGPKIVVFSTMVKDRSVGAFNVLKGVVMTVFNAIKGAISTAVQFVRGWIDKHRADVAAFGQAWKNVGKIVAGIAVVIGTAIREVIEHVYVPVMKVALSVVKAVWPSIRKIVEGVLGALGGVVQVFSGIFTGDFNRIWTGVKNIFRGGVKAVLGIVTGAAKGLLKAATGLAGVMLEGIGDGLGSLGHFLAGKIGDGISWAVKNIPAAALDALKSLGVKVLDAFTPGSGDGIGKQLKKAAGDGLGGFTGLSGGNGLMGAKQIMAPFASMAGRFGLHTSSGARPGAITSSGNVSWHSSGNAIDEAGTPAGMLGYFRFLKNTFGSRLRELIYTPGGVGIKDGKPYRYTGQVAADHFDHVHVAFTGDGHGRKAGTGDGIGQLKSLWTRAGGSSSAANTAAAIAMAESGGNPGASNRNTDGSIDRGLWQINSVHGAQSTFDRLANARAAVSISSNGHNWNPWTVYKTGAYRRFLSGGSGGGSGGSSSGGSGGSSKPRTGSSGGPPPAVDNKAIYGVTESTVPTFANTFGTPPVKGRGDFPGAPHKGGATINPDGTDPRQVAREAAAAAAAAAPSEFDYLDLALANAEATPDTGDDRSALTAIRDYRARALNAATATGDPRQIAQARRDLTSAESTLNQLVDNTKALTDALTTVGDELKRQTDFAASVQNTSNYQLTKTLADLISGHIVGRGVAGRAFTPGTGVEVAYMYSAI